MTGAYPEIHPLNISRYFLEAAQRDHVLDMTPMKILKLVYIAHGWHLGFLDEPLIAENAQAWQYGPVVPSVYHEFKKYGRDQVPFSAVVEFATPRLVQFQDRVLQHVWTGYRHFSGTKLSEMTHREGTPWWKTWHEFGASNHRGVPIDNLLIRDHYRSLLERPRRGSA